MTQRVEKNTRIRDPIRINFSIGRDPIIQRFYHGRAGILTTTPERVEANCATTSRPTVRPPDGRSAGATSVRRVSDTDTGHRRRRRRTPTATIGGVSETSAEPQKQQHSAEVRSRVPRRSRARPERVPNASRNGGRARQPCRACFGRRTGGWIQHPTPRADAFRPGEICANFVFFNAKNR